jgi:two-component system, NtrC family, response regulator HydG
LDHRWPGNVRELEHLVERVVLLGRSREVEPEELPRTIGQRSAAPITFQGDIVPLREMQRRYAAWVLDALGGRRMLTAERLAVDIKTLARMLRAEPEGDGNGD